MSEARESEARKSEMRESETRTSETRKSESRKAVAIAVSGVLGLAGLLVAASVAADPASSAQSAWSPLPPIPRAPLENPLEQRGREVFEQRCAACHGPIPKDTIGPPYLPLMPGTQALQARYKGVRPAVLEERTDLTAELVNAIVRNGLNSMPFFRPTELSDDDLIALDAYLTRKAR